MDFSTYICRPFTVDAVEINENNIEGLAKFIGELKHKEDGTPYIKVDKRLVRNVPVAYLGFWMTKLGKNVQCHSPASFNKRFVESTPENLKSVLFFQLESKPDEEMEELPQIEESPTADTVSDARYDEPHEIPDDVLTTD